MVVVGTRRLKAKGNKDEEEEEFLLDQIFHFLIATHSNEH
jgi:hypothetical protein